MIEEWRGRMKSGKCRGNLLLAWALTLMIGALDAIWAGRLGLTFTGWTRVVVVLVFLLAIGFLYGFSGRDRRLSDAGNFAAIWVAFSSVGAVFTYLAATFAMPLRDADFVALDAAMGFHWHEWFEFVAMHRAIRIPLFLAYFTFLPQIVGSILYFAHTGQTARNIELIWIAIISLTLTSIVSAPFPAVGPYVHFYGRQTPDIVALMAVRAGGPHIFVTSQLQGLITFPSFHTVLAIAFIYVHRPPSRSFIPVAILDALMLIAIPSEGHHYLIDMVSGAAIAAISIAIVRAAIFPRSTATAAISKERDAAS